LGKKKKYSLNRTIFPKQADPKVLKAGVLEKGKTTLKAAKWKRKGFLSGKGGRGVKKQTPGALNARGVGGLTLGN